MFLFFGFGVFVTMIVRELDLGRIFAEPFFYFFLAVTISLLCFDKPKNKLQKYLVVIPIIFILLSLPLNMSLPDHSRILHYHTESSIPMESRISYFDISYSDFQLSYWIQDHVSPNEWLSVDLKGFHIAYLADHINKTYQSFPRFSEQSMFLIIPLYFVRHNLWITPYPYSIYPSQNVTLDHAFLQISLIYNNGQVMLVYRTFTNETS